MEGALIQKPALPSPQRPTADFSPFMEEVVQCRAFKAGRARKAIPGPRKPRPGHLIFHSPQKRLVDLLINHSGRTTAKLMGSRHRQSHRQVLSMKNNAASRPAPDRRTRPGNRSHIGIPLRISECDGGRCPAVEPDNRASRLMKQRLIQSHLPGGGPCLPVFPNLESGYHRQMDYHQGRRNPLLLLVGDGIARISWILLWQSRHLARDSAR